MTRRQLQQDSRHVDVAGADSFPASDPPARSGITGVGRQRGKKDTVIPPSRRRTHGERPTGDPRHAQETAHFPEDEDPG